MTQKVSSSSQIRINGDLAQKSMSSTQRKDSKITAVARASLKKIASFFKMLREKIQLRKSNSQSVTIIENKSGKKGARLKSHPVRKEIMQGRREANVAEQRACRELIDKLSKLTPVQR